MSKAKAIRALRMPSGSLYTTGANFREQWALFQNARLDLIEMLAAAGRDNEQIARLLSLTNNQIHRLLELAETRAAAEAGAKAAATP